MVRTWKTGLGEDFTCPYCSAVYETKIYRSPARDAKSIIDIATGGEAGSRFYTRGTGQGDPATVAMGKKGGRARADSMTAERRWQSNKD
jgi:hypothetical protein